MRCLDIICPNVLGSVSCFETEEHQCQNQNYGKGFNFDYFNIVRYRGRGRGLKAKTSFVRNQFVCEYVGNVTTDDVDNEYKFQLKDNKESRFRKPLFVDATKYGNASRYINHSCSPNCKVYRWLHNGYMVLGIYAIRDIQINDEITINYDWIKLASEGIIST